MCDRGYLKRQHLEETYTVQKHFFMSIFTWECIFNLATEHISPHTFSIQISFLYILIPAHSLSHPPPILSIEMRVFWPPCCSFKLKIYTPSRFKELWVVIGSCSICDALVTYELFLLIDCSRWISGYVLYEPLHLYCSRENSAVGSRIEDDSFDEIVKLCL